VSGAAASPVTEVLERIDRGDRAAVNDLIPLVYQELRERAAACMSASPPGHTLQPTALVHEAFAKIVSSRGPARWQTSRHFFHGAAEVMRQILVDHARAKSAQKRGGGRRHVELEGADVDAAAAAGTCQARDDPDWEALDRALVELRGLDERRYRVVMLRYFAGLSEREVADALDVSEKTVRRDWNTARTFLQAAMAASGQGP
jgi:RNA polymerase sigma factor (TIGR02999 family)